MIQHAASRVRDHPRQASRRWCRCGRGAVRDLAPAGHWRRLRDFLGRRRGTGRPARSGRSGLCSDGTPDTRSHAAPGLVGVVSLLLVVGGRGSALVLLHLHREHRALPVVGGRGLLGCCPSRRRWRAELRAHADQPRVPHSHPHRGPRDRRHAVLLQLVGPGAGVRGE